MKLIMRKGEPHLEQGEDDRLDIDLSYRCVSPEDIRAVRKLLGLAEAIMMHTDDLEPCPACRTTKAEIKKDKGYYRVICPCGMHGPSHVALIMAVGGWNANCKHLGDVTTGMV